MISSERFCNDAGQRGEGKERREVPGHGRRAVSEKKLLATSGETLQI